MTPTIGARVDAKRSFFDRIAVINAVDKATRKALGHIGGTVMKTARNSIIRAAEHPEAGKKGKKVSKLNTSLPGHPPLSHAEDLLKRGIFYAYDRENNSVVIGPVLLNGIRGDRRDALEMLEYGGYTTRRGKPARYRARPFMGPAMENSAPFDRFWKDSVK